MESENFRTFVCHYEHDGSRWGLDIKARDWDDARARVARLGALRLDGELRASIPVTPATRRVAGLLVRAYCGLRNLLRRS